jgi:uncharacterized protein (DUF1800 family)
MRAVRALLVGLCLPMMTAAAPPPAPPAHGLTDVALLDRLTWGATEADLARLRAMGRERWLEWQLHPTEADRLPPAAQARIDALPISQAPMADLLVAALLRERAIREETDATQQQTDRRANQQALSGLGRQAATREVLRDLYSPAQLREVMTWFWFNHFNVYQFKANVRAMVGDYEERAIRPHALGRFRDLLAATLRHPAMLRYLDDAANVAGRINENYAREIMELHTMGVGSGYTQHDVEELARCLTGLTIDPRPSNPRWLGSQLVRDGLFEFNPARHDYGDKVFLGHVIKGSGLAEADEVIDILARQPATAHHIAAELATFFVADTPPPGLVDRLARSFLATDGDIGAVLGVLFHSPEFAASPGRFKDPMHYVLSAVRLAYGERVILNAQPILFWLNRMGEGLYNHQTPDGYPLRSDAWNAPGQLEVRFEIARRIGYGPAGLFKDPEGGVVDLPAFPRLQNVYFQDLQPTLGPATLAALEQATSPQEWNFLFLSSPEFMF